MDKNYEKVPAIISTKDLDYLSDIYNWNFNASKLANSFAQSISDEEIKALFNKVSDVHKENAIAVLNILE